MSYDLVKIKKKYGEKMMHLCRSLFPSLLEKEGLLYSLLESNFAYSKFLVEDIISENKEEDFKNYIYSLIDIKVKEENKVVKPPQELLNEAGYILYKCNTEEDIQKFKKYYRKGEELCTFNGERLKDCYVFFAVKKNVANIKRENFSNPDREDEYGTSVISIQFSKGKINTLSIKNRYNHTVKNPDATFSNNLDNIIEGLTQSFENQYQLKINKNTNNSFELFNYVKANDGKYYKYNYEIDNVYYCTDNIIIDNFKVIKDYQDKCKYLLIDYFIVDLASKKISLYDDICFFDGFLDNLTDIKKIEIIKLKVSKTKIIKITFYNGICAYIEIDRMNNIISYENKNLTQIGDAFLYSNHSLNKIDIPNVTKIGDDFLASNTEIKEISIPQVKVIGDDFLSINRILEKINLPKIVRIGDNFLQCNKSLKNINFPKLMEVKDCFLEYNEELENINSPKLIVVGESFLRNNKWLTNLDLPSLEKIGNSFMLHNFRLININLPNVLYIGDYFLRNNNYLKQITLPYVRHIGSSFLEYNESLLNLEAPNLNNVGSGFLSSNDLITQLYLPNLQQVDSNFLPNNQNLRNLETPDLKSIGNCFLYSNKKLKNLNLPVLESIGNCFLCENEILDSLNIPNLTYVGHSFLFSNTSLHEINIPNLISKGDYFLCSNKLVNKNTLKLSIPKSNQRR